MRFPRGHRAVWATLRPDDRLDLALPSLQSLENRFRLCIGRCRHCRSNPLRSESVGSLKGDISALKKDMVIVREGIAILLKRG